jgi:hypothetical protein
MLKTKREWKEGRKGGRQEEKRKEGKGRKKKKCAAEGLRQMLKGGYVYIFLESSILVSMPQHTVCETV